MDVVGRNNVKVTGRPDARTTTATGHRPRLSAPGATAEQIAAFAGAGG